MNEFELLAACARTEVDATAAAGIAGLIDPSTDWPRVVRLAARHGVRPLLYRSLHAVSWETVPAATQAGLREQSQANARKSLQLWAEFLRLRDLFDSRRIPVLPLKGPALAACVYGNLGMREFSDLDIFIRKSDVFSSSEILIAEGYQPDFRITEAQRDPFLRYACELGFVRKRDGTTIELQWQFVPRYFTFDVDFQNLWNRLVTESFGGRPILAMPRENLLLYLCVHGAKHGWSSLKWICDVAEAIRASPDLNWDLVFEGARRLGGERFLLLGLCLATGLLGAKVPPEIGKRLGSDASTRRLAREICLRLSSDCDSGMSERRLFAFHLKCRERFRDRVRMCYRLLATPTVFDWRVWPLPRPLFFLYYFMRPFRLASKYLRKSSGS